ncbi:MAG: hypothetical protein KGL03_08900, partial [Nitrospirota bacterium]|nr:hypothetical protein [Nitrospirota bacterium]
KPRQCFFLQCVAVVVPSAIQGFLAIDAGGETPPAFLSSTSHSACDGRSGGNLQWHVLFNPHVV